MLVEMCCSIFTFWKTPTRRAESVAVKGKSNCTRCYGSHLAEHHYWQYGNGVLWPTPWCHCL